MLITDLDWIISKIHLILTLFKLISDPIFQHHQEESNIIGSSLGSPVSEDSKDVEDLVNCH